MGRKVRCRRFITSIWTGLDIGSYMLNTWKSEGGRLSEFSDILLDGQQRFHAIQLYIEDNLSVPDKYGSLRYWSELPTIEKKRLKMTTFPRSTINCFDEEKLRTIYDLHNFGGTTHTEEQRASC